MGIESLLWLSVKLQDDFDLGEMILKASIDDFAGIGKVLGLAWVWRPLALAKVFAGPQTLQQSPHKVILLLSR